MRPAFLFFLFAFVCLVSRGAETALEDLWRERVKCVVAVEFYADTEAERQTSQTFGTVIDAQGTIIFPSSAINSQLALSQFTDFRVYLPGSNAGSFLSAQFLGIDELTGWAFVRVKDASAAQKLIPVTRFGSATVPRIAQELWGIGLRKKDENFAPYFLTSRVSILQRLPQSTALTTREVTGTGLPVFDQNGDFVGLGVSGFGQALLQFSARDRGGMPVVMIDPDECAAVLLASEVTPYFSRIPQNINGRPLVWLGADGLEPLDAEVADYLGLKGKAALVVSDVLESSPAAAAGMMPRDVIVSLEGEDFPALKPDRMLVNYFQREVDRRSPDDVMHMEIIRNGTPMVISAILKDAPALPRELPRYYFERLGFSVRGFAYVDGVVRRKPKAEQKGAIVTYVRAGSPAATAGLRNGDWVKAVDGGAADAGDGVVADLKKWEDHAGAGTCVLEVEREDAPVQISLQLK